MNTLKAKDLNEAQREEFSAYFYEIADFDDTDSSTPWGCPWYFGWPIDLNGNSIKEMVQNFYNEFKDQIIE